MRTLCDLQGREVGLGRCLGRGGEGAVYAVPMWPRRWRRSTLAARTPALSEARGDGRARREGAPRRRLAAGPPPRPRARGPVVGFLMPRVDGHREIHALYGPRPARRPSRTPLGLPRARRPQPGGRLRHRPRRGHVIGDVNQGNVVVSRTAPSGSSTATRSRSPTRAHVPLPRGGPALHAARAPGPGLQGVRGRRDHDRFGLAVLLFHLLFMGRHPFAGRHPHARSRWNRRSARACSPSAGRRAPGLAAAAVRAPPRGRVAVPSRTSSSRRSVARRPPEPRARRLGLGPRARRPRGAARHLRRRPAARLRGATGAPAPGAASRTTAGRPSSSWPRARPPTRSTSRRRGGRSRRSSPRRGPAARPPRSRTPAARGRPALALRVRRPPGPPVTANRDARA